ncbi:hypothetical protein RI054_11g58940 [Pseudoscourfieldia marina]
MPYAYDSPQRSTPRSSVPSEEKNKLDLDALVTARLIVRLELRRRNLASKLPSAPTSVGGGDSNAVAAEKGVSAGGARRSLAGEFKASEYTRARRAEAKYDEECNKSQGVYDALQARVQQAKRQIKEDNEKAHARFPEVAWCARLPASTLETVADVIVEALGPDARKQRATPEHFHRVRADVTAAAAIATERAAERIRECTQRLREHAAAVEASMASSENILDSEGAFDTLESTATRLEAAGAADRARAQISRIEEAHERACSLVRDACERRGESARHVAGRAFRTATERAARAVQRDVRERFQRQSEQSSTEAASSSNPMTLDGWLFDNDDDDDDDNEGEDESSGDDL